MKKRNQEKGVVLLTCLVFLLVLLGMLRFTLTSAKVEEQKAGIDLEITSAREAAQTALMEVEKQILVMGLNHCIELQTQSPSKYGDVECEAEASKFANHLLRDDTLIQQVTVNNEKIYNRGLYIVKQSNNDGALTADKNCAPFYRCVDWSVQGSGSKQMPPGLAHNMSKSASTLFPSIECRQCNTLKNTAIKPRYIIERFKLEDLDTSRTDKSNTLVLRVTALGFGKGNDADQITTSLLQANYLLPGDED